MKMEKVEILDGVFLVVFDSQLEITSTFLRFQEYYESPKFRGKIFSLNDFKKWYSEMKGVFSYYTDWNGFNIPSEILQPFYEGKFDPLSQKEKDFLELFKNERGKFYIIGVHKSISDLKALLQHEIAHGLFYTNENYKKNVLKILNKFDVNEIKKELKGSDGYHDEVLDDEAHAYALDSVKKMDVEIPRQLHTELKSNFQKVLNKLNVDIEDIILDMQEEIK
jgi:hypothetical protein